MSSYKTVTPDRLPAQLRIGYADIRIRENIVLPTDFYIGVAVLTLLLAPTFALWLVRQSRPPAAAENVTQWLAKASWMRVVTLVVLPVWWSSTGLYLASGRGQFTPPAAALLVFVLPLWFSIFLARVFTYRSDARVFARGWTQHDIFRLAWWRTVASTVPYLILAVGLDELYRRSGWGIFWLNCAGVMAIIGRLRLERAEGIRFRPVKSGELYKRATILAKRIGVRLRHVSVIPFGRGRLTNAYSRSGEIAVTDDYGHWLHGTELDFVIAHELAHAKRKHGSKAFLISLAVFVLVGAAAFVVSYLSPSWKIALNFGAILFPAIALDGMSRQFEYAADRGAIELTGDAQSGLNALTNMYRHAEVPADNSSVLEWFSTHPGLWRRVSAIARAAHISEEEVSTLRARFNKAAAAGNLVRG